MIHCALDIETFSTRHHPLIASIGAVFFRIHSLHIHSPVAPFETAILAECYQRILWRDEAKRGEADLDPETAAWWARQSFDAQTEIFTIEGRATLRHGLEYLSQTFARMRGMDPDIRVWAKGPSFDCVHIAAAYDRLGLPRPWAYHEERCVRTITDILSKDELAPNPLPHHALHDATTEARDIHAGLRKLLSLGRDERPARPSEVPASPPKSAWVMNFLQSNISVRFTQSESEEICRAIQARVTKAE